MATELSRAAQLSWRRFLSTDHGQNGLLVLRERSPRVNKGDSTEIIFNSGKTEGYREAIDSLSDILAAEPEKPENLEND